MRKQNITRFVVFGAVAAAHVLFLVFFVVRIDATVSVPDAPVPVMKLADIDEAPPPPPPPPREPEILQSPETVAENFIETEELPPLPETVFVREPSAEETYLPMHRVSVPPSFVEADILRALVYPPIAQRSGVEGIVHLELLIDRYGRVQRVDILRESPENYGFGEAAARAFRGRTGVPAQANGVAVGVRFRYPVRFRLR